MFFSSWPLHSASSRRCTGRVAVICAILIVIPLADVLIRPLGWHATFQKQILIKGLKESSVGSGITGANGVAYQSISRVTLCMRCVAR
jgi:hypothetical protein